MTNTFKMIGRRVFVTLLCCAMFTLCGCGDPRVQGTVTFADGSRLTTGVICYESGKAIYYADVLPNGTYSMGKIKDGEGIPRGEYKVYFQSAEEEIGRDEDNRPIMRPLLDEKFYSPHTSELTCTVDGKTRLDIQVTAPGQ